MIVARITNDRGRAFNVRLVRKGDRYGRNDCLVHDQAEPMVEFYDATYEADARFDVGRGQFVSRYSLGTLTGKQGFYGHDHRQSRRGLDLCGHEPAWKISGENVIVAIAAVEGALVALAEITS